MEKQIILSHLLDYLKLKKINYELSGKILMLSCPFCDKEGRNAQKIPNTYRVNCYSCKKKYNLIDIARKVDNLEEKTEKEVIHYLKELLDIKITTTVDKENIEEYFKFYEANGFDLVPIVKDGKRPIQKSWTNKEHKDKDEWANWVSNGLNLGVKTGRRSNITILDIDQKPIPEKLKKLLGKTLVQESTHGFHYIYQYESDLPKTRVDKFQTDIENDGGQVVIYPSVVKGIKRIIKELNPIAKMPKELKEFLKKHITTPKKTFSEGIREDIKTGDFKIDPENLQLKNNNLEGCCNSEFIRLGGVLRKQLSMQQTGYVLHVLNKHLLADPMNSKAITAMLRELDKYRDADDERLSNDIMNYLKDVEEANRTEIAMAVVGTNRGEDKKRIDKSLKYLVTNEHLIKRGTKYELIQQMDWTGSLMNIGVPVKFEVPFFHRWAYLNQEDVIIIGSQNKYGKTTLAMNIVKRLVEQGITPDYIYNESGGRFAKIALKLGMKDDDFYSTFCADPDKIILRKNKVVIFDWVKPKDFARTDNLFSDLVEKIKKVHGFMICFVQLRTNDEFFAKDQISQFPALVSKYVYEDESGVNTKFLVPYVREAKMKGKNFVIPCVYNWETHEVKTAYELEEEKKK